MDTTVSPAPPGPAVPQTRRPVGASRLVTATFGVLAALAAIEHGIGEIAQGPVAPPGVSFASWPDMVAFEILQGEPAMTLIPNLLVTGILTIIVAVVIGIWTVRRVEQPHGGLILIGLSVLLLLVGGGYGPPLIGLILGLAAIRPLDRPQQPTGRIARTLAGRWRWFLTIGAVGFLALMPGTVLLSALLEVQSATLVLLFAAAAFGGLGLALLAARIHDRAATR